MNNEAPKISALPRYSLLTLCIRAALFGASNPLVQHMAKRNQDIAEHEALEQAMEQMKA